MSDLRHCQFCFELKRATEFPKREAGQAKVFCLQCLEDHGNSGEEKPLKQEFAGNPRRVFT